MGEIMRVGIAGACGRMGHLLCNLVPQQKDMTLTAGLVSAHHRDMDLGPQVTVTPHVDAFLNACDGVIDFSIPAGTHRLLTLLKGHHKPIIVGTTGLTPDHHAAAQVLAQTAPVIVAPNTCLTVTLLLELTRRAASALGDDFDIEIQETHHRHKVDAPSGTALAIGRAAAQGRGISFEDTVVLGRQGLDCARKVGDIGIVALRGGEIAGQHTIHFHGNGESLSLTDQVYDRAVFAKGAITALRWLGGQKPGLYTMKDVLGL